MKGGEIMKVTKKLLALCIFITMLVTTVPQGINACTETANCYATGVSVTCGAVNGYESGQHKVEEPNGYVVTCKITAVYGPHTLKCAACEAYLGTDYRTCAQVHSNVHCYSRYNLCK